LVLIEFPVSVAHKLWNGIPLDEVSRTSPEYDRLQRVLIVEKRKILRVLF